MATKSVVTFNLLVIKTIEDFSPFLLYKFNSTRLLLMLILSITKQATNYSHYFSNKNTTNEGRILLTSITNWIILMKQRWQLISLLIDIRICLCIVFSNIIFFFVTILVFKWHLKVTSQLKNISLTQVYFFLWKMNYSNIKGMGCLWIINYDV